jgi:hypothetical protein
MRSWIRMSAVLLGAGLVLGTVPAAAQNVAEGKTASQSSTVFGGTESRAVDGNRNGNFFLGSV